MDDVLEDLLVMTARWDAATRWRLAERFLVRLSAGVAPAAACVEALGDLLEEQGRQ